VSQSSIYKRVFLPYSLALLAATACAYFIATYLVSQTLEARLENRVAHTLDVLAAGRFPLTPDLLQQLAILQEMDFILLHADGSVALTTYAPAAPGAPTAGELAGGDIQATGVTRNLLLMSRPIARARSQQFHTVIAAAGTGHVVAATRSIALTLAGVTALTLLGLAFWGHRSSRALSRPIKAMVDWARDIADGSRHAGQITTDIIEVQALADALADMNDALARFEQELARTHRLQGLGELAAQVAHEIRNPLTALKLNLQLLLEDDTAQAAALQPLMRELERLELVVNATLSMARPIHLNQAPRPIEEPVTEVLRLLEPQLAHRNICLRQTFAPTPPVSIDADRIKQVVFNLVNNAADAGEIAVRSFVDEEVVALLVEDSGPGLEPQQLEQLFTPDMPSARGLGIGLLVCKEIMDLHNGDIIYRNSDDLGGACFKMRFPLT